ncbi:hypothetical protein BAUCODRAFT_130376 [Baudoinia panamericana UAMH 10762]|uniref:Essential protein Yae1 N-terminal domain-containing protein n=1 Tax=Baudoinia panamericana (strain UAMH 10762) TaxID=717646 RepID=M2MKB2_BAUPA|nr:uncharacterized protein BAUCODRAFT_130376 [Baudoinia panamericana UAMH 10762]EMC97131.1 hypothetical protein BAUCODRAFT_130376 [Baudoinia panamericana UAMH 10762]
MSNEDSNRHDPFDSLLSLEDQYYNEGYNLGVADGTRSGRIEGRLFGLEKGFEKFAELGRLNGKAAVWHARLPRGNNVADSGRSESLEQPKDFATVQSLNGSERLKRHIDRLLELTEPDSLETKNTEEAVNDCDERLAGAKAKATLIARIVSEDVPQPSTSNGNVGNEETEITRSATSKPRVAL